MTPGIRLALANAAFIAVFLVSLYFFGLLVAIALYIALNAMAIHDAKQRRKRAEIEFERGRPRSVPRAPGH